MTNSYISNYKNLIAGKRLTQAQVINQLNQKIDSIDLMRGANETFEGYLKRVSVAEIRRVQLIECKDFFEGKTHYLPFHNKELMFRLDRVSFDSIEDAEKFRKENNLSVESIFTY